MDADYFARLELDELLREVEAFTNRADTTIAMPRVFRAFAIHAESSGEAHIRQCAALIGEAHRPGRRGRPALHLIELRRQFRPLGTAQALTGPDVIWRSLRPLRPQRPRKAARRNQRGRTGRKGRKFAI